MLHASQNYKHTKPTFVATGRQTVIDITLASSIICVSDEESLSDHTYIKFQIQAGTQIVPPWRNPRVTQWCILCRPWTGSRRSPGEYLDNWRYWEWGYSDATAPGNLIKNNCEEHKTHTGKGAWWWYPELEWMHKNAGKILEKYEETSLTGTMWEKKGENIRRLYVKVKEIPDTDFATALLVIDQRQDYSRC